MDEKSKHHEKDTTSDDDEQTTTDSRKSDSESGRTRKSDSGRELEDQKEKQPPKETLASFFKTKEEREQDKRQDEANVYIERPRNQDEIQEQPEDTELVLDSPDNETIGENLTNEEVQEATLAIVDARTQEIAEELEVAEPDSVDEFEALADAVFLESLQDLASNESEMTPEVIDAAFDEALEDLSIGEEITEPSEEVKEVEPEDATEPIADLDEDDSSIPPVTPAVSPLPIVTPPLSTPPTPPVAPPMPPVGPPTPPMGPPVGPSTPGANYNYNQPYSPNMVQHNMNTPTPIIIEEIHNHHSDLLLGAILGYIIGRRGGRKRTEKKLLPKIEKLEEQVKTLHDTIIEKEVQIRKIARENAETIKRKLELNSAESPVSAALIMERRKTRKEVKEILRRREILASDPGVEKIGKFSLPALKVFHERRLPDGTENNPARIRVEVMNEAELLDKAQPIVIHNLSIVEMYMRNRLGLESLRQVTKEYLRSGPYEQTFLRELLPDPEIIKQKRDQVAQVESMVNHQNMGEIYSNQTVTSQASNDQFASTSDKNIFGKAVSKNSRIGQAPVKKMVVSGAITGIIIAAITAVALLIS